MRKSRLYVASTISSTFSGPALASTSSNLSSDQDVASSSKSNGQAVYSNPVQEPMSTSPSRIYGHVARVDAPQIDTAAANAPQTGHTTAIPMSLVSPTAQGFKRSADGLMKGDRSSTSPTERNSAHKRNKSMDTHSNTRIGELSAQLKTRLSYAMVKVQNGWEKQSLEELEEVHSQRGSPNSAPGGDSRAAFGSPSTTDYRRRPSAISDNSDYMMISPASESAQSHAVNSAYWRLTNKPAINAAANLISITGGNALAPASEFEFVRRRRSSTTHPPPSLLGSAQRKHHSDVGASQRAPTTPRAGILRMPSQQAEKDAVDTLLFMSSPKNSQHFPHTSQAGHSTLREGAPQRRVMFEAYPPQDRRMAYQSPMPTSSHYTTGPYAPQPAR
ncbi:uncharacterized protein M421DRAFT_103457 [Didymella exigua CBS 183.55]|uniref:Cyclin-dependent kinase n=1 Tax=Didymella exigua CBS 183.55 TaxID=1150837 RepID=A0A6A5RED8_9PLEO|nr:uncharacterized protein M421DRAFT_103457 [Didymella exigua CBS 183.55]KAF1924896.1 hypothetical protein M421DRAFT_103457 [Didymella exigua CBS 183.55]